MLEVSIAKIENAGKYLIRGTVDVETYSEFVATFNTYYERKRVDSTVFNPEEGEMCACYAAVEDSQAKLWYRGQIIGIFNSTSGYIVKCLLVDEGEIVCVTKTRMRKLHEQFESFPPQVLQCVLHDVTPITLGPNADYIWSMKKTHQWDSSATKFVEDLLQDKRTFIVVISRDKQGLCQVELFIYHDRNYMNVNKLLIEKGFATPSTSTESQSNSKTNTDSALSKEDLIKSWLQSDETKFVPETRIQNLSTIPTETQNKIPISNIHNISLNEISTDLQSRSPFPNIPTNNLNTISPTVRVRETKNESIFNKTPIKNNAISVSEIPRLKELESQNTTNNVANALGGFSTCSKFAAGINSTPNYVLPAPDNRRRKAQQQKIFDEKANKQCEDLLKILHGDDYKSIDTSGTSDLSDMETTPAPKMSSFKLARSSMTTKTFLENKLDQESSDFLAQAFGISNETPKSTKEVSFSAQNDLFDIEPSDLVPGKAFELISKEDNKMSIAKENLTSYFDDGANILNMITSSESSIPLSFSKNTKEKLLLAKDVLVYGKLKSEPLATVTELDLQLPLRTSLKELSFYHSTPFQAHMWPAVSALRYIVGITESNKRISNEVLSYALPIIRNIVEMEDIYKKQGTGNGPYLLIFVSGWKEAQEIYDILTQLAGYYRKQLRIDIRYGGMDNDADRDVRLVNGCEILIATLPSFNRAYEAGYTNYKRLCHVVFENSDSLVENFTEDIRVFMRSYGEFLKALKRSDVFLQQIIAIGTKWTDGMRSFMTSYMKDPLVIISNKIEMALFAKVPINVELCSSDQRLDVLIGCLTVDAVNHNTVVFTNSAKSADDLKGQLKEYGISTEVISEFITPVELKDIQAQWNSQLNKPENLLVISDNAVVKSGINNASFIIHYDYPQKKSQFGNRLHCLTNVIKENENKSDAKDLMCHVFVTEQNNGMRYSTGLVKLLKRSGQNIPKALQSMAESSRELKEEQKQFSELCPRLKLFGECSFIDDCSERHTIFPDKDLLGLCPSTGFVKILILDVISASNFWGRIVEHRLPFDPSGTSSYDTNIFMQLYLDMQTYYSEDLNQLPYYSAEIFDLCVVNTLMSGYQRVRIERVTEKELERPKKLEVFGIDSGLTTTVKFTDLLVCADRFKMVPPQAVEIITCCVKPVEQGLSWTHEASFAMEKRLVGKTLEGRVNFSLQNTIWVDPLVEKEILAGLKTKTYSLDVGRDLISMGYAEKNTKHVENLRKLLYDVLGHPLETGDDKKSLPYSMLDHEVSYLQDDDYEDVYVSAVVHPELFFVHRMENADMIEKLDDKIHASMSVKDLNDVDHSVVFPIGCICVAKFTIDEKWYRVKIVGINETQTEYDVFYVDHGDREWLKKSHVHKSWPDILTPAYQAIECSFRNIKPIDQDWSEEDGDQFWDLVKDKLLVAKVLTTEASDYIHETLNYEIELFDTTNDQTMNISHELVYMGVGRGLLQCLQAMFPHASVDPVNQMYKDPSDECADLCLAIHQSQDVIDKINKGNRLLEIISALSCANDVYIENGAVSSICRVLALSKSEEIQQILLQCMNHLAAFGDKFCDEINDHDAIKVLCGFLKRTSNDEHITTILQTLLNIAADSWYHQLIYDHGFISSACLMLETSDPNGKLLKALLDCLLIFCKDQELSCSSFRQEDGLDYICSMFQTSTDQTVLEKIAGLFRIMLTSHWSWRNQEKMAEIGGIETLSSISNKNLTDNALNDVLETLIICVDNVAIKQYLVRINAKENIKKCADSPKPRGKNVRNLFQTLLDLLTPDEMYKSSKDILPHFKEKIDIQNNVICETKTPMTVWSQRRNTVTLSVRIRGAMTEVTNIEGKHLEFRCVLSGVKYILDLILYDDVIAEESQTLIKGGEVLIVLKKLNAGELWPRLLESEEKVSCISIDFDRWVDEFKVIDDQPSDIDGVVLFRPGLPKPPPCEALKGNPVVCFPIPYPSNDAASEESDDDDDEREDKNVASADYFDV